MLPGMPGSATLWPQHEERTVAKSAITLHKDLGVPVGKKIPQKKLDAKTLRKMKHGS